MFDGLSSKEQHACIVLLAAKDKQNKAIAAKLKLSATTVRRVWRRNGTTTLFAALNVLDVKGWGQSEQRFAPV